MSAESVDEDNLHISNAGTNGQYLQKQTGNAGGLTWGTVDLTTLSGANLTSGIIPTARINASSIANDLIDSQHYAANSIDAEHYAPGSVDTTALGADSVTTAKIADSVALGGSPTTTTQTASDNSTKVATTAYTDAAIAALADSAPATLNTLNELAAALGDDANYANTITTALSTKANVTNPAYTSQQLTDAATISWDAASGGIAKVTITANRTMAAPSNLQIGTYILEVWQDGSGSRVVSWNSVFKWNGGVAPVLSTAGNAKDVLSFYCDGTNLIGGLMARGY
tara:strand:- start:400 stop:1251 length:852 start_codon:yes stop_codon:yes gene_type:complete